MDTMEVEDILTNKFLEFRQTSIKIGLEEALVQYSSINQTDWRLQTLYELYYIDTTVKQLSNRKTSSETPTATATAGAIVIDRTGQRIRAGTKLLSNASFIKGYGKSLFDIFDKFAQIMEEYEQQEEALYSWKHLLEGLLHLPTRCDIMEGLALHNPIDYASLIDELFQLKVDAKFHMHISEMIYKVVETYPNYASIARFKLVEMRSLPDLVTRLTVVHCGDTVDFLNGIFAQNLKSVNWFLAQSVNSGHYFVKIKQDIMVDIVEPLTKMEEHRPSNLELVQLTTALRVIAGIVGYFGIKLVENEVMTCLQLLEKAQSKRLIELLFCLLLLAADQFLRKQKELTHVINQLIKSNTSELPLLMYVYFQTDAIQQIEDNVRSILSMQLPIHKLGLFELQKLFRSIVQPA